MPSSTPSALPFRLTRFLSWISLVLILASSITLAFFLGNSARSTLLTRQQDYARLMAANLNHQIYRRFTLPTYITFGRIALSQSIQYEHLDEVVRSTIHGLHVETLRIYGADEIVNYSTEESEVGRKDLTPPAVPKAMKDGQPSFAVLGEPSIIRDMFYLNLPQETYILQTIFPLIVSIGPPRDKKPESVVTGVLEIRQDITDDYVNVIRFQWMVLGTCLLSSAVLFIFLQLSISRAERILTERMARTLKLESELHENEKLVSMGRVIASIAHEIRNPLGIIRSSSELLLRRSETSGTTGRILGAIYDEACRLSQLVNDFLDYARPRVPKREPVNIAGLFDQAQAFLGGELERRGVELVRHLPPELNVLGDKDLLYRAFYNLLVNAMEAIEREGVIRVRASLKDNTVEITIHDSGCGFPAEHLPQLLDPFFTTKNHGSGLGLPIVNTIIISHNGRMILDNDASDGGALVSLSLPAARNAVPDDGKTETAAH